MCSSDLDIARETMTAALQHPALSPTPLLAPIVSLARSHPAYENVAPYLDPANAPQVKAEEEAALLNAASEILSEPLLQILLRSCVVADVTIERLIILTRRLALHAYVNLTAAPPISLDVLIGIGHQCFITEYLYRVSGEENAQVENIRLQFNARNPIKNEQFGVALLASYVPLISAGLDGSRIATYRKGPLATLISQQLDEPTRERDLRASIPRISDFSSETSQMVGAFYEENPYPRWVKATRPANASDFADRKSTRLNSSH